MGEIRPPTAKRVYLLLAPVVFVLDQWTKWWVEANLALHRPLEVVPGFLNLTHVQNPGVAFGLLSDLPNPARTLLLTALGLAALVIVSLYYARIEATHKRVLVALSLIIGGAIGNLTDRVLTGSVTDFVDAYFRGYHWHTFNVADSAITIAVLMILWDSFRPGSAAKADPAGVGNEAAEVELDGA